MRGFETWRCWRLIGEGCDLGFEWMREKIESDYKLQRLEGMSVAG